MTHNNGTNGITAPMQSALGRPIKFTPERLQQIRNLVERGTGRDDIAKMLGVTLGSLQVTCSKVGISLRHRAHPEPPAPVPVAPALAPAPSPPLAPAPPADHVSVAFTLRYQGRERATAIPLDADDVTQLVLEAELRGMTLGQLISAVIVAVVAKDDFRTVLGGPP